MDEASVSPGSVLSGTETPAGVLTTTDPEDADMSVVYPTSIGHACRRELEVMGIHLPAEEFYCRCFLICLNRTLSPLEMTRQQAAMLELMNISHGRMDTGTVVIITVYVMLLIAGIIGNILVLVTIARFLQQRTVLNVFIASLSCADLLVVLVNIPTKIWQLCVGYWLSGKATCYIWHYLWYTTFLCSVMTLTAMSIERYLAICHPMRAQYANTMGRAKRVVTLIWIAAAVLGIPTIFVTNYYGNTWVCNMVLDGGAGYQLYSVYLTVAVFFVPTTVMATAYLRTSVALWKSVEASKDMRMSHSNSKSYDKTQGRLRVIRMLVAVWLLFMICWLPFMVGILMDSFDLAVDMDRMSYSTMMQSFMCLAYSNSCINPFLYALFSTHFRKGFRNCFYFCCPLKRYRNRVTFRCRSSLGGRVGDNSLMSRGDTSYVPARAGLSDVKMVATGYSHVAPKTRKCPAKAEVIYKP